MNKLELQDLHKYFSDELKRLNSLEDSDQLKPQIVSLKKEIEEVAHLLPRYQQLTYSEKIKELQDSSNKMTKTVRRFKINRDRKKVDKVDNLKQIELKEEHTEMKEDQVIRVVDKVAQVRNCKNCIIVTEQLDSVTVRNVENSVLLVSSNGSLFIHNVSNSLIFAKCQQLRIHDTINSKFITDIKSKSAVMEGCKELKFNGDLKINDFSHPFGASPNYTYFDFSRCNEKFIQAEEIRNQNTTINLTKYLSFI